MNKILGAAIGDLEVAGTNSVPIVVSRAAKTKEKYHSSLLFTNESAYFLTQMNHARAAERRAKFAAQSAGSMRTSPYVTRVLSKTDSGRMYASISKNAGSEGRARRKSLIY